MPDVLVFRAPFRRDDADETDFFDFLTVRRLLAAAAARRGFRPFFALTFADLPARL